MRTADQRNVMTVDCSWVLTRTWYSRPGTRRFRSNVKGCVERAPALAERAGEATHLTSIEQTQSLGLVDCLPEQRRTHAGHSPLVHLLLSLGSLGLMYEVVWLRVLGLVFGHTVYAVTTVLAAFMSGLALGSFLFGRRAPQIRNLIGAYGVLEIGIGLYCALIPILLSLAPSPTLSSTAPWASPTTPSASHSSCSSLRSCWCRPR